MEPIQQTDSFYTPEELAARLRFLFRTMADFYRAAPWQRPELADHTVIVTIPELAVREAAVQLIGDDLPPGFFLYESVDDIERLCRETYAHSQGWPARCPSVVTLTYEPPPDPRTRARVEAGEVELAAPDAFPLVMRVGEDCRRGPPEPLDIVVTSAIAAAMTAFVPDDGWEQGKDVIRRVRIHLGEVAVSLRNGDVSVEHTDVLARMAELSADDAFQRIALEEELLRQFACELGGPPSWVPMAARVVLDAVFRDHAVTIGSLRGPALRTTLFETIPEANLIDASQAPSFIVALEAFLLFMKRTYALPHADELLRVVGPGATERLESRIRAVAPGWVPHFVDPVDMAPRRTDRAARRARRR